MSINKLRIGFVSPQDATSVLTWSGTPLQMLSAMQAMEDVEVELFTPLDRRLRYALAPARLIARARGQGYIADRSALLLHSYARQIKRRLAEKPVDVLFAPGSIPYTYLDCSQPLVFWTDSVFHGVLGYFTGVFDNLSRSAIERSKQQEELALKRCSAAVYASEWAASTARTLTDPGKIHVLPFGSSLPVFTSEALIAQRARDRRRSRPDTCNLLFVGIDWKRKGGDIAVETARLLNEQGIRTTLRVVGAQLPGDIPPFVESLGFINKSTPEGRSKLIELYEEADLFLLPTQAEAAGIVFCEASSLGLPSLSCDTGGVGDYVRTGVNGVRLAATASPHDFAEAAKQLLQDPEAYEALCVSSFREYTTRLNWGSSVAKLVQLCRTLA